MRVRQRYRPELERYITGGIEYRAEKRAVDYRIIRYTVRAKLEEKS